MTSVQGRSWHCKSSPSPGRLAKIPRRREVDSRYLQRPFRALIKSGTVGSNPIPRETGSPLTWNDNGRYTDRWVRLSPRGSNCVFLRGIESLYLRLPMAKASLWRARTNRLSTNSRPAAKLSLRYGDASGADNPNGSVRDVAGLSDETGRVFGLMPHPERHVHPHAPPTLDEAPQCRRAGWFGALQKMQSVIVPDRSTVACVQAWRRSRKTILSRFRTALHSHVLGVDSFRDHQIGRPLDDGRPSGKSVDPKIGQLQLGQSNDFG